jgi:glycosyltransferase involved in cell wall biosynthesis
MDDRVSIDASVIIPARDAAATLGATLAAIARQDGGAGREVIVVDDGSADDTVAVAQASAVEVRVIRAAGSGPAAARNLGAAAAAGRILAFTDADCVPEPGWLAAGLAATESADLVQGRVLPPHDADIGPYDRYLAVTSEYGLYETANLFVARELFHRLGGFESILTPRRGIELGEDVWLGWRARRAGARTAFSEAALVRHAVFPRGPRGYVAERARLRFFPELAGRIPELREGFLYRRWFLSPRSARFDLAVAGAAAAVVARRAAPALLALPYLGQLRGRARAWPRPVEVAAVELAADAVGAAAMLYGSIRSRSLLL